jgi:acetyltransferase-like isoleucine patch superfamily enzyme
VVLATRRKEAVIQMGHGCGLTGAVVIAADRVEMGDRVQVGGTARIVDTDFHPLTPESRAQDFNAGAYKPIIIEDDVFIGMNSLVLKGVTLAQGCVVGAGSVVTRDVPARTIVAGNPAQAVRRLDG